MNTLLAVAGGTVLLSLAGYAIRSPRAYRDALAWPATVAVSLAALALCGWNLTVGITASRMLRYLGPKAAPQINVAAESLIAVEIVPFAVLTGAFLAYVWLLSLFGLRGRRRKDRPDLWHPDDAGDD